MNIKLKILIADDHQLFRKGMINILNQSDEFEVVGEAEDGYGILKQLETGTKCDLILLDVNMPKMNGVDTVSRLKRRGITIPVLMLSMEENEKTIIQLIKMGIWGYVLKDASPDELKNAIRTAAQKQYFINGLLSPTLINAIEGGPAEKDPIINLSEREIDFLKYCASECTYKEIATEMTLSPRTIDGYRDLLFNKLQAKSRVGLALYAIKKNLINL